MNVLGLFSGIGGFELGFKRAGFTIAAMCEIEPYARSVLNKQFPGVPIHGDIRHLRGRRGEFDIITGGFPCQDISLAGKGAGLTGERSGLWTEYRRLIDEIQPAWVVIENVSALRSRGLDVVLGQLAEIGYDAEWHCVPASACGAPHRRDRVWIVAHPARLLPGRQEQRPERERAGQGGEPIAVADAQHGGREGRDEKGQGPASALPCGEGRARLAGYLARQLAAAQRGGAGKDVADADNEQRRIEQQLRSGDGARPWNEPDGRHWWLTEPNVGRVANGVPSRVDRLRALGNAVVPQIPEALAWAIRQWEFLEG